MVAGAIGCDDGFTKVVDGRPVCSSRWGLGPREARLMVDISRHASTFKWYFNGFFNKQNQIQKENFVLNVGD